MLKRLTAGDWGHIIDPKSAHAGNMDRTVEEIEYVLSILHQMREQVIQNPELFDHDAQERIDKAMGGIQAVIEGVKAA